MANSDSSVPLNPTVQIYGEKFIEAGEVVFLSESYPYSQIPTVINSDREAITVSGSEFVVDTFGDGQLISSSRYDLDDIYPREDHYITSASYHADMGWSLISSDGDNLHVHKIITRQFPTDDLALESSVLLEKKDDYDWPIIGGTVSFGNTTIQNYGYAANFDGITDDPLPADLVFNPKTGVMDQFSSDFLVSDPYLWTDGDRYVVANYAGHQSGVVTYSVTEWSSDGADALGPSVTTVKSSPDERIWSREEMQSLVALKPQNSFSGNAIWNGSQLYDSDFSVNDSYQIRFQQVLPLANNGFIVATVEEFITSDRMYSHGYEVQRLVVSQVSHNGDVIQQSVGEPIFATIFGDLNMSMLDSDTVAIDVGFQIYDRMNYHDLADGDYHVLIPIEISHSLTTAYVGTDYEDFMLIDEAGLAKIQGGAGDDVIYSIVGPSTIDAGDGDDEIFLGSQSVWSNGFFAVNASFGGVGTGEARSVAGMIQHEVLLVGGEGSDTVSLSNQSDAFFADDKYSIVVDGIDSSTGRVGGIERIMAGAGDDIIDLTSARFEFSESMIVYGQEGNDVIWSGAGNDFIDGGIGDDVIAPGTGRDVIDLASGGADLIQLTLTSGHVTLDGFDFSNDKISLLGVNEALEQLLSFEVVSADDALIGRVGTVELQFVNFVGSPSSLEFWDSDIAIIMEVI